MIWLIADTHFEHRNIIRYAGRPFLSIEEMNHAMIVGWQNTVKPTDLIIHLGDFGFGPAECLREILDRLPGRKLIILGNHDRGADAMMALGFHAAIAAGEITFQGQRFGLSHRPPDDIPPGCRGVFHGHIHAHDSPTPRHLNLCVEHWEYRPISLRTASKALSAQLKS